MTPTAVLVLVVGVLVVLAVAGTALALDARRRRGPRSTRPAPAPPPGRAPRPRPEPTPTAVTARQVEPIDTVRAQQDPPTVMTTDTGENPTVAVPRDAPDVDPRADAPAEGLRPFGLGQGPGRGPAAPSERSGDTPTGSPRNGGPSHEPRLGPTRDPRSPGPGR